MNVSAPAKGIVGTATATSGTTYGVQGVATGTSGVGLIGTATSSTGWTYGLRGTSSSTSGTGVRGIATATSGSTTGVSGYVASSSGTAGVFNNAAGGRIISGQNNGVENFSVDGSGNVNAATSYQIGGQSVLRLGNQQNSDVFIGVEAGNSTTTSAEHLHWFQSRQQRYHGLVQHIFRLFSGRGKYHRPRKHVYWIRRWPLDLDRMLQRDVRIRCRVLRRIRHGVQQRLCWLSGRHVQQVRLFQQLLRV